MITLEDQLPDDVCRKLEAMLEPGMRLPRHQEDAPPTEMAVRENLTESQKELLVALRNGAL